MLAVMKINEDQVFFVWFLFIFLFLFFGDSAEAQYL